MSNVGHRLRSIAIGRRLPTVAALAVLALVVAACGSSGSSGKPQASSKASGAAGASGSCPRGATDHGVTASNIQLAFPVINIAGGKGNALFGVPSAAEQQRYAEAVLKSLNAHGGIRCRQLTAKYYPTNGADPNARQATCLQIVGDKPFAVIDPGVYYIPPNSKECFGQHRIPFIGSTLITDSQAARFKPYLFSFLGDFNQLERDTVLGASSLGLLPKTAKVGVLQRTCSRELNSASDKALGELGLGSKPSIYNEGCPAMFASPDQLQQAVLQFKQAGTTQVLISGGSGIDIPGFTKIAQQQHFTPKYILEDDGIVQSATNPPFAPDQANFDGAVSVTYAGYGQTASGSISSTPATSACDSIMASAGFPPVDKESDGWGGIVCDQLWMFKAMADHAPTLTRKALGDGLGQAGTVDFSYPGGVAKFRSGSVSAGQGWRAVVFSKTCAGHPVGCWSLLKNDATFHPNFQ